MLQLPEKRTMDDRIRQPEITKAPILPKRNLDQATSHLQMLGAINLDTFNQWVIHNPGGVCVLIQSLLDRLTIPSRAAMIDSIAAQRNPAAVEGAQGASGGAVGALDLSAPPKVWLQIDIDGNDEDRSEPISQANWGDLTWYYESLGGQEVVYIRQDLAAQPPATGSGGESEPMFYIQDTRSFVGNCVQWWGPDNAGYVTRLDQAGKYPKERALAQAASRGTDVAWPCEVIDKLAWPTVDMQDLRHLSKATPAPARGE